MKSDFFSNRVLRYCQLSSINSLLSTGLNKPTALVLSNSRAYELFDFQRKTGEFSNARGTHDP